MMDRPITPRLKKAAVPVYDDPLELSKKTIKVYRV